MMLLKAQVSAEFIIIVAILAILVVAALSLSVGRISDMAKRQTADDAHYSVQSLADAADFVYWQGEGATRIVTIRLPSDTDLAGAYIGGPPGSSEDLRGTLMISVNGNNYTAQSAADLNGSFPNSTGMHNMKVVSRGTYVSITPQLFDLGSYAIFVSMGQNQTRSKSFMAYSTTGFDVPVNISYNWDYGGIANISIAPLIFNATTGGTNISINVTSGNTAGGPYTSQISFTAGGASEDRINVPVSIDVQAG